MIWKFEDLEIWRFVDGVNKTIGFWLMPFGLFEDLLM